MTMTISSVCASPRVRPRIRRGLSSVVGMGLVTALGACTPLDQRLFDPQAGVPPKPHLPPVLPARPVAAPFLRIISGTPRADWVPAVDHATKLALSRKPSVLFIVTAVASSRGRPSDQVHVLDMLINADAKDVAEQIVASGASTSQVQMEAKTESSAAAVSGSKSSTRVDLR